MPKLIPSIYNYCDRWCERCHFINRCAVGIEEMEYKEKEMLVKSEEERKELLFSSLTSSFQQVRELLDQFLEEKGIDLDDILEEEDEEFELQRKRRSDLQRNDPAIKLGLYYAQKAHKWLQLNRDQMIDSSAYVKKVEMGLLNEEEAKQEIYIINDQREIIQFYMFFIATKISRAVMGYSEKSRTERSEIKQDYNGTAKVAGIAIDRSIVAWLTLTKLLPNNLDEFIPFLARLEKMQKVLRKKFPYANKFIRPGFDTGE